MTAQNLDAFFDNAIVKWAFLWAPILTFGVSLWFMRRQHITVKVTSPVLIALSSFLFCSLTYVDWTWRNAIGSYAPGSIHEKQAVSIFMNDSLYLLRFCGALFILALLPCLTSAIKGKRRQNLRGATQKSNSAESL